MSLKRTMVKNIILCPRCDSNRVVKNGDRQFVLDPKNKIIEQETKDLIDKLLLEKLPLAGIARVTGVSERGLQTYVNAKFDAKNTSK